MTRWSQRALGCSFSGACRLLGRVACVVAILCIDTRSFAAGSSLPPEVGWDYGDMETGRGAALSGSDRAQSSSYEALLSNPANMASARVYHVGALASIWPEARRQTFGAAIVDSSTSSTRVAGGFSALWTVQDHDGINRLASEFRLGLAMPFSEKFRAGVTGRYLSLRENGDVMLPSVVTSGLQNKSIVKGFAFDIGATLEAAQGLALSIVGTGLNGAGTGFQPTVLGGGIGWTNGNLTLEGDAVADFATWDRTTSRLMAGVEYLIGDHYPIRAGYRWDSGLEAHAASAGLGYISNVFSLEFGARRSFGPNAATALVFSLAYHVESAGVGGATSSEF